MRQKEVERMIHFLARLWTLAKVCEITVTCPNEPDCGRCIDYSSDIVAGQMVAGLTNMEHQSKILAGTATLTTLQQKFNRWVSLEIIDQLNPHFSNTMHHTTMTNVQRLDCKQQSWEVRTSPTPQYVKSCSGKYSHLKECYSGTFRWSDTASLWICIFACTYTW